MGLFDSTTDRQSNPYLWTQDIIQAIWQTHWTPEDFNFIADKQQFKVDLTESERQMVTKSLAAIGQIEIAVKRFWADLGHHLPNPHISDMGLVMASNEVVHNQAYEKLLNVLQLEDIFETTLKDEHLQNRLIYLRKHTQVPSNLTNKQQFVYKLVLFTLFIEHCSLFSQFYIIMNLSTNKGYLKGVAQQVQYTRQEEELHSKAGTFIVNTLRQEYPEIFTSDFEDKIYTQAVRSLQYEHQIIDWLLSGYSGKNLSTPILKEYIENRMFDGLASMGFKTNPKKSEYSENYKWFVDQLNGTTKTDFFNKRPTDYTKNNRDYDNEAII